MISGTVGCMFATRTVWALSILCVVQPWIVSSQSAEVRESDIEGEGFIANFYCREDVTNRTGVLFLGGSEGGRPHGALAEAFARNGFPTLAVAYFREKGLPQTLESIPLEYFDKPIAWMNRDPHLRADGIVIVGVSRGAELALLLGSTRSDVKGVIALSPSSVVWFGLPNELPIRPCSSWTLNGKPVPFVPFDPSTPVVPGDLASIYKNLEDSLAKKEIVEKAAIHVEQIHGPVLLASGQDDKLSPSEKMGEAICARLKEKGFKYRYAHSKYKDAGHTLGFGPAGVMGGTAEGNKAARNDLVPRMLNFLKMVDQTPGAN